MALLAVAALTAVVGVSLFYALVLRDLPELNSLADYEPRIITRVYAHDGSEIGSYAEERRIVVPIEDVPRHVIHAFIAAEDAAFYDHQGLDYPGIFRALLKNLRAGAVRQGGSTITQQVAKTFLLSSDRTYIRKLKDMVLARRIEQKFDKEQILYLYLNQIYLGSGAYGVEAAAQTYFNKPARELTVGEGALVAGIVPRPSVWTPLKNPEAAKARQIEVLKRMRENAFLTAEAEQEALAQVLEFAETSWTEREAASAYFVEEVRRYLVGRYGEDSVKTAGMKVYTTLRPQRQLAAYRSVRWGLREHDQRQGYRGPIRNVASEAWEELIAELGETNAAEQAGEELLHRALITKVDVEAEEIELTTGPDRSVRLPLEDVKWAREPNPRVDGTREENKLKRVSQAFKSGDLIWLEVEALRLPEDPLAEEPPEFDYALYQEPRAEAAIVSIDIETAELDALVGGYSFSRSQFNRALQSRRQPGSAFKPIVYAAALRNGYSPASIVYDTPITYVDDETGFQWKPENYSRSFYGPITLRWALAKSRNIATLKILSDIGLESVVDMARSLGIESPLSDNLGLGLGNSEVTLVELVRAYTVFAASGKLIDPVFIREIRDRNGELLEENVTLIASQLEDGQPDIAQGPAAPDAEEEQQLTGSALERLMEELRESATEQNGHEQIAPIPEGHALDPATAFLMTNMLEAVVQEGTGRRVARLRRPVAGKTGTTNNLFDAWFIGFTPQIAAGAWVGYDQAQNLGRSETGSRAASPIFLKYMREAHNGQSMRAFDPPSGVAFVQIDRDTGLLPCGGDTIFQPFREGNAPERRCDSAPDDNGSNSSRPLRLD